METLINKTRLILKTGDLTLEDTDAIVNAANSRLAGGGGVDGAIHRAGGGEIMRECVEIGRCPAGEAVITTGGRLKARFVIHTVGPIYRGGGSGEAEILRSAYLNSLSLALNNNIKKVAFPSISTGAYGYPIKEASMVALKTTIKFLKNSLGLSEVRFVLFKAKDLNIYEESLRNIINP